MKILSSSPPRLRPSPPAPAAARDRVTLGTRLHRGSEGFQQLTVLALTANAVPAALSAGVSALFPGWVPAGGWLANAAAGAVIGGLAGYVQGGKFGELVDNPSFMRSDGQDVGVLEGAICGAVCGLGGSLASPSLGWVSRRTLALALGGWSAAAAAGSGVLGFLAGVSNDPR